MAEANESSGTAASKRQNRHVEDLDELQADREGKLTGLAHLKTEQSGGKRVLKEADEYDKLGYCFPSWKKWMILTIMFCVQISINLNASLYANGVKPVAKKFGVSEQAARVPQLTFLCAYAFGCELWYVFMFVNSKLPF